MRDDLTLPTEGELGSTITWKSSDPEIIAEDGKVTRPVGEKKAVSYTHLDVYKRQSRNCEDGRQCEPDALGSTVVCIFGRIHTCCQKKKDGQIKKLTKIIKKLTKIIRKYNF